MTLVEFSLLAPLFMLLVLGIMIASLLVSNQIQLNNISRDGARAAAVCGGIARNNQTVKLPNGQPCTDGNLKAYIQSRFQAVPTPVNLSVVVDGGTPLPGDVNVVDECQKGRSVHVIASYQQTLYVPFVARLIGGDPVTNTRSLSADAAATCEV